MIDRIEKALKQFVSGDETRPHVAKLWTATGEDTPEHRGEWEVAAATDGHTAIVMTAGSLNSVSLRDAMAKIRTDDGMQCPPIDVAMTSPRDKPSASIGVNPGYFVRLDACIRALKSAEKEALKAETPPRESARDRKSRLAKWDRIGCSLSIGGELDPILFEMYAPTARIRLRGVIMPMRM